MMPRIAIVNNTDVQKGLQFRNACVTNNILVLYGHMDSMRNIYESAGKVIKLKRKAFGDKGGMKQEVLARAAGLTRTSISNIEIGRQKILLDTFCRIAIALDLTPVQLMDEVMAEGMSQPLPAPETTNRVKLYLYKEVINKKGATNAHKKQH